MVWLVPEVDAAVAARVVCLAGGARVPVRPRCVLTVLGIGAVVDLSCSLLTMRVGGRLAEDGDRCRCRLMLLMIGRWLPAGDNRGSTGSEM